MVTGQDEGNGQILKIIPELALQQHIAILGKTGSGKTFAAKGIVEGLLKANRRVGVVDPTDAWWGLRSGHDGTSPGFPILVLGGDHGDLPLPALGGAAVARLLINGANLVASTKHLTVGERTRWFIDFAGTLNRLNRAPLHLILDEAHNFAPQGKVPDPDTGKMLHAANTLASGGRAIGIRLIMITQRPQKLHKDALTSADTLIAMRVLAPHDRLAVEDWIKGCGDLAQGKEVLNSLASLQQGEGWVWYPEGGHLARVKFPPIGTFDSSATPTEGHALVAPKGAAEIDLTEIKAALADAVKEAEANDPKLLRAEVAKLKKMLDNAARTAPVLATKEELDRAYSIGHDQGCIEGWNNAIAEVEPRLNTANLAIGDALKITTRLVSAFQMYPKRNTTDIQVAEKRPAPVLQRADAGPAATMPKAERLILTALAQYPQGRSKVQVAILTGYTANGGGFRNSVGSLRSAGLINGVADRLEITHAGLSALGQFTPLPHGQELLEHWFRSLGRAERKILEVLTEAYPHTLSKAQIATRAGYETEGGGFRNALGKLRTLELIEGRGEMRAKDDFFQ